MATNAAAAIRRSDEITPAVDNRLSFATAAGNVRAKRGELAVSVDYDARKKRLHIELGSGVGVSIPISKLEGFAGVPPSVIRAVRIEGGGYGLYWPSLDLDLAVPELIAGCFGSRAWMSALARQGGKATTTAKRRAARENGKKGGRPPKLADGGGGRTR
jgi:hypothetical protein